VELLMAEVVVVADARPERLSSATIPARASSDNARAGCGLARAARIRRLETPIGHHAHRRIYSPAPA